MEFRKHTLDNGLAIISEVNPRAHSLSLGFFVSAGSRDESDELSGVSHFLEHMVFKGTERRSAAAVNRELDEIGSHSNAFTSEEQTVYYASVIPEHQDQALDLLADILRPALRDDDFNTEKQVILEEISKYDDQPPFGGHERSMAAYFGSHPLARSVLGTAESVGALTPGAMRAYFESRYAPSNMTLVATGRVDFDRLAAEAERLCGAWAPGAPQRDFPPADPQHQFVVLEKETATQQYLIQLAAGPAAEDDDRFAGRLLAAMFGDDSGSRLFWELVDNGRADYAVVGPYEYQRVGVLLTYLCCEPELAEENLAQLAELQRDVLAEGFTADELERAKTKLCSHAVLQAERSSSRLFSVGNNWIQRRQYRTIRETLAAYQAVSLAQVNELLERYPMQQNTTVAIGPLSQLNRPNGG